MFKDLGITFYRGILTGFNDAFWISKEKRDKLIAEDKNAEKIIKPFLRGKDIDRYKYNFSELYLIYSHSDVKEKDYPGITEHLKEYKSELKIGAGANQKVSLYEWWQLQVDYYSSGTYKNFEKEKLIWMELTDQPKFTYDDKFIYPDKRCWI
ncbi:MAG: hypothetical protein IPG24_03025 [Leptospiraceae bacterium]|nr:hypothetical protein [Leptospiraceae bacterium]